MSRYKVYSDYRDSGVEWLGMVPSHWTTCRIKNTATVNPAKSEVRDMAPDTEVAFIPMEAIGEKGELDTSRTKPLSEVISGYSYVADGDIMIAKITPCFENGKGAIARNLANGIGFATTEVINIRPDNPNDAPYLHYLLSTDPFRNLAEGAMYGAGGQKRVADSFVAEYHLSLPALNERTKIAAFLDHETAKIDALIEKQQRLIELLKEKRQAVISHAVTKGLNPNAPMKDSGVEWLGDVPAHWCVIKLGYLIKLKGGAGFPDSYQGQEEHEIPFYKVGDLARANSESRLTEPLHTVTHETAKELRATIFSTGSIVFAKVGAALLLKRFCTLNKPSCIDNNMMGAELGSIELREFLLFLMPLLDFELIVNPGAVPSVNGEQITSILIALSTQDEQIEIVHFLKKFRVKFDTLISNAEQAIGLLQERRTALISAAVTGKIDVRDWQPAVAQAVVGVAC